MATNLFTIVYMMQNLASPLRLANGCQARFVRTSVTLLVLWYLFVTYRAAQRCTISILLMLSFVYVSQTEEEYLRIGRTTVK